jgi:hypothetical protein
MADSEMPASEQDPGSGVALQVVEALRSGGGVASLRSLLGEASLSEQHRDVLALLEILDAAENGVSADAELDALFDPQSPEAATELQACREEVADLREVNDATAAALGACRICWGGNRSCPVCGGHGRPGANLPDLRLYDEIVRPAVERMSTVKGLQSAEARAAAPTFGRFPDEEAQQ